MKRLGRLWDKAFQNVFLPLLVAVLLKNEYHHSGWEGILIVVAIAIGVWLALFGWMVKRLRKS